MTSVQRTHAHARTHAQDQARSEGVREGCAIKCVKGSIHIGTPAGADESHPPPDRPTDGATPLLLIEATDRQSYRSW